MSQQLIDAIVEMREEDAQAITQQMLDAGTDPLEVLEACRRAMEVIGQRFESGDCFIPELILAGEMLNQITEVVKPRLQEQQAGQQKLGQVIIGTVEGDIHDIAKDIVAFMLDINGFAVTDLGVDVPPAKFVAAAQERGAKVVALSGFLTLAYDPMKDTVAAIKAAVERLHERDLETSEIDAQIKDYTGADAYGRDAMAAVNLAKQWYA